MLRVRMVTIPPMVARFSPSWKLALRAEFGITGGNQWSVSAFAKKSQPKMFELHAWLTCVMGNEAAQDVSFREVAALWLDSNVE